MKLILNIVIEKNTRLLRRERGAIYVPQAQIYSVGIPGIPSVFARIVTAFNTKFSI